MLERYAFTTVELADNVEKARADKNFAECRTLISVLKALPDSKEADRLCIELGTVIVDLTETSQEVFYCPICGTRQVRERTTCTMCGIEFMMAVQ